MFLKEIVYELNTIRKIPSLYKVLGKKGSDKVWWFVNNATPETLHLRRISVIRSVAALLNVPPDFLVRMVRLGGMKDDY